MDTIKKSLISLLQKNPKAATKTRFEDNTHLVEDLGFDSLDIVTLVISIESEFNISFDIDELEFESVIHFGKLLEIVQSKVVS
jgi:acyl carrier protein